MIINIYSAKCIGIDAVPVTIEINITAGIGIHLVGLADIAVKESLLRTMTALQSMGFRIPGKKIVINLAPADMHKSGSGYDLPIALGIIAASEQASMPALDKYLVMGELGLDASVRDVPGGLPITELAVKSGFRGCILPVASALEAVEYRDTEIFAVKTLADVIRIMRDDDDVSDLLVWNTAEYGAMLEREPGASRKDYMDFSEIIGQEGAKRGLEIAAAGGHNVIMIGSPGSGKSSLAKALAGILPPMEIEESIVTSKIYSVAGRGGSRYGLIRERPFRSPHYSASMPAIIGGGNGDNIMPGEVSLAQSGILFLDEFAQMPRSITEALRSPLEDRKVVISRLRSKVEYPASFMMVAATNPCPCGYYGEGERCTCSVLQRQNYLGRLSGPIMDRIDVQLWLHPVEAGALVSRKP
ncbi:MAG: YifB family Mg chelatase-like AAA ATPase, partial [Bacteroidales bacterium]|nr:YifB family Mg chelatase-like AAA ATPase [Bacteroidales bacterium]